MPDEPTRIKRYPNRRFYDTGESKYVSLKEIEEMVRTGRTIEVVEQRTGEDITRNVLTQIILDQQPEKMSLFPVDMLHSIVRSNDVVAGFLRDYFLHARTYLDYLQQHGKQARDLANPMHWVKAWLDGMKPTAASPAPTTEAADGGDHLAEKIEKLEERIRQLEAKED